MQRFRKTLTLFDDYYDMMSDKVRMESYRKAIFEVVRKGDIVVDLGAGLGILSFFALQAGAEKVYAIEKMDSINLARQVASLNGFADRIVFFNGNSKNIELPEKADCLVSETLGSFALEENTLDFTIDARKRFVKQGGRIIPERLKLWLVPVEAPAAYQKMVFWNDIYGIDFAPARDEILRKLLIEPINPANYLAAPEVYKEIDLYTAEESLVRERNTFEFIRSGVLHGLGGWFKVWLTPNISFDTAPASPETHWRQAFFPLKEPIRVNCGDKMMLELKIAPKTSEGDDTLISYDYICAQMEQRGRGKHVPEYFYQGIGRNDPCPCRSGKKYKKCCGR